MRVRGVSFALILMALAADCARAADEPVVLEASSKWAVDYSDDSCALRRVFGEGTNLAQLELRRFSPGASMQVVVVTNGSKMTRRAAQFRFEPNGAWIKSPAPVYFRNPGNFEGVIFSATVDAMPEVAALLSAPASPSTGGEDADGQWAETTGFSVKDAFNTDLTLQTGAMLKPHQAMEQCLAELLTHWGIDVEAHRTLQRRVEPKDIYEVVRRVQREYPSSMLRKGMPGIVNVRLGVDETGKVSACHIQLELSDDAFERTACKELSAARFEPALDKDGKPIASYWTTAIFYQIR